LTREKLAELLHEGVALALILRKRIEPMKRLTAEDFARVCR
jgi:hypothetical protein